MPKYQNLIPEHAMWLMRAQTLGFKVASEDQFANVSFNSQEHYISKVRNAISNYRLRDQELNRLFFQADSNITILMVQLHVALTYFEREDIRLKYQNSLDKKSINATTFHLYAKEIKQAILLTRTLSDEHKLQDNIENAYNQAIHDIVLLEDYLYPSQEIETTPMSIQEKIFKKIKTLFQ
jgi:hypothetical protein